MDTVKRERKALFGTLLLISVTGVLLVAHAIYQLKFAISASTYVHLVEISLFGLLLSPWSVKLPSGASWRPSMPLLMLSIFAVPPALTPLVPIPSLLFITLRAKARWWKYIETISHVAIGLYSSALIYRYIAGPHRHSAVAQVVGLLIALIMHLTINRLISSIILAYTTHRDLFKQIQHIVRELHWGHVNSYLIVFLAVMNQLNLTISILVSCALQAGILLAVSHYSKVDQLQKSIWIDGVTNCENRNAWEEWVKTSHNKVSTGILFVLDIDNFKIINDTYGHLAGDNVLRDLTAVLTRCLPSKSRLFRYGGDEFIGYVESISATNVRAKIQSEMASLKTAATIGKLEVAVSLGVASAPFDSILLTELFQMADARMYEEKRNRRLLFEGIEIGIPASILSLVVALESRDMYTGGHIIRVAFFALELAEYMGVSSQDKKALFRSALVHDIGKIGIPDAILNKAGDLNSEETKRIHLHPEVGYEMCSKLGFTQKELETIKYHHEQWDGSGYPEQLAGTDIPLLARIVALADVYDALTSNRSYRDAWSHAETMRYILDNREIMFDPECVDNWLLLNESVPVASRFPEWVKTGTLSEIVSPIHVG